MSKTNPIGIRFDPEKLELVKKEQDLKTPQRVVNWFFDTYQSKSGGKAIIPVFTITDKRPEDDFKFDFSSDVFLNIEKYTKYPKNSRPTGISERARWDVDKYKSDSIIRAAWSSYKESSTQ